MRLWGEVQTDVNGVLAVAVIIGKVLDRIAPLVTDLTLLLKTTPSSRVHTSFLYAPNVMINLIFDLMEIIRSLQSNPITLGVPNLT